MRTLAFLTLELFLAALLLAAVPRSRAQDRAATPGGKARSAEGPHRVVREQVRGDYGGPEETILRIRRKAKALDAGTLAFEDGTRVNVAGLIDPPALEQQGLIGDRFYPCGREALAFLRKLIGERPVTFYGFGDGSDRGEQPLNGHCFVGETSLAVEMVRNGWALSNHSGMTPYEILARENERGLWRGRFVVPRRWRKGERLPGEREARATDPEAERRALAALRDAKPAVQVDATRPGRPVVVVHFPPNAGRVRDEDLVHLRALPHLRSVALPNKRFITDAGLAHLEALDELVELDLNGTRVTPAGVIRFAQAHPRLRRLNLTGIPLTDADLTALARLADLEALSLRESRVTDQGLAHLKSFPRLRELSLMSTRTGDVGLAQLSPVTTLEDLDLDRTAITDAGLKHLATLRNLRHLQIAYTAVTDAGLEPLQALANLKSLNLRGTHVTGEGVARLKRLLAQLQVGGP